jgi:(1->4)-alpha-D-glucan 1-alpha-D-glucosylmutase
MRTSNDLIGAATRVPRATYRLQFNEHFRLRDGTALVPYLCALGISHIYASPLLMARPHSVHGYDICDFHRLNPELGTEADLAELVGTLRDHGMGLVLDVVPNHMGIGSLLNSWWWSVLSEGLASPYARYFDIEWDSPDPRLRGKVLLPVLADAYDRVLERGELQLAFQDGAWVLRYFDQLFPVAPASLPARLAPYLSRPPAAGPEIREINASVEELDRLLRGQHYLLTDWRAADSELNYRRFFTIAGLAGLRIEDEQVFAETHALIGRWLESGWLDGLRVDHPDGLRLPEQYLRRLRALAPKAWIVVEKIIEPGESVPAAWPVAGTTGYDFLNLVGGLFVDPNGEGPLADFYAEFTGEAGDYSAIVREKKLRVLRGPLATEVNRLARILIRITAPDGGRFRFKRDKLRDAISEVAAAFPVYRTYADPAEAAPGEADATFIGEALDNARQRRPDLGPEPFDLLGDLLLLRRHGSIEDDFMLRFQQLTGPVMAKGVEDTAFFCFNRLLSLNEVGGDPGKFGVGIAAFHEACRTRRQFWPYSMLATSTHDTKRSEDVRARLHLLSEVPQAWRQAVLRWAGMNERHRRDGWPDRNAEYYFYQTLFGAWPLSVDRALACMEKATREARQHTGWKHPDAAYETAMREFVTDVLGDAGFREDLERSLAPLVEAGEINSLAQTLLKLTAPGVPDFYQGSELWDLSLTDPDNRRPIDFGRRRGLLARLEALSPGEVWRQRAEGLPKLWLIRQVLAERRHQPDLFAGGSEYEALSATGTAADHAIAFMRGGRAITVVPRLVVGLDGNWGDTTLDIPQGQWKNVLTGESIGSGAVPLAVLLSRFPVALLIRKEAA